MSLRDLVSGRPEQRRFVDPVLGELTAEVRPAREREWHSWSGRWVVPGKALPTSLSLYGDGRAPDPRLLGEVHRVLRGMTELEARVGEVLAAHPELGPPGEFGLAQLSVWDEVDDALLLEFVRHGAPAGADLEFELSGQNPGPVHRVRLRAVSFPNPAPAGHAAKGGVAK